MLHFKEYAPVLLVLLTTFSIGAQPVRYETATFTGAGVKPREWFGSSISGHGNAMVVGAYGDVGNGVSLGAAYVFEETAGQWTQKTKLMPSNQSSDLDFGRSVSMSAEWTVVGAPGTAFNMVRNGAAYVFDRSGQATRLVASDGREGDRFGSDVAIDGNVIAIGAAFADRPWSQSGSAYIFERVGSSWNERHQLVPFGTTDFSSFGNSLDLSGNHLIGGATSFGGGVGGGQAFIFEKVNEEWVQTVELSQRTFGSFDGFGAAVAINDRYAFVGAPSGLGRPATYLSGAVCVYEKDVVSGWRLLQVLTPSVTNELAGFGGSLDLKGDELIVGSPADTERGVNTGAGYVYRLNDGRWNLEARLLTREALKEESLGNSAYIGEGFFALGAPSLSTGNPPAGYVHIFVPEPAAFVSVSIASMACVVFMRRRPA